MQFHVKKDLLSGIPVFFLLFIPFVIPLIFLPGISHTEYNDVKQVFFGGLTILFSFVFLVNLCVRGFPQADFNLLDAIVVMIPLTSWVAHFVINRGTGQTSDLELFAYLSCFYFLAKFTLCGLSSGSEELVHGFLRLLVANNLLLGIVCFLQIISVIPYVDVIVYESVVIGTMGNPNGVGSFLAISTIFLVAFFQKQTKKSNRYLIGFVILLGLAILIATKSRGSYLALSGGLIFYYFRSLRAFWLALVNKVGKIIPLLIGCSVVCSAFYFLVQMNVDSSLGRIYLAHVCLEIFTDFPVNGVGYGNYFDYHSLYQTELFSQPGNSSFYDYASNLFHPSNEFFYILAEGGIVGLVLFVTVFAVTLRYGLKVLRIHHEDANTVRIFLAAFIAVYIHCIFDSPLFYVSTRTMFYFIIAVISFFYFKTFSRETGFNLFRFRFARSVLLVVICISVGFGVYHLNMVQKKIRGFIQWRTAQIFTSRFDWAMSLKHLERAAGLLPDHSRLSFHKGLANLMNARYSAALEDFNRAEHGYRAKELYVRRAYIYASLSEYQLAETDYVTAIEMYPHSLIPRLKLGEMYFKIGKVSEAKRIWESILRIEPRIQNENSMAVKESARMLLIDHFPE